MNFAEEVKSRVTVLEVFQHYGFRPNRAGFLCCPLHGEKTPSLKVYSDGRGWCCFGCHKGGDVINFVREYFGLSFAEALTRINDDFSLGLPIGEQRSKRQRLADAKAAHERKRQIEREQEELKRLDNEYWAAFDRWKRLDDNLRDYAPKRPDEEFHKLFVEALANIGIAAEEMEEADCRRRAYGREYSSNGS